MCSSCATFDVVVDDHGCVERFSIQGTEVPTPEMLGCLRGEFEKLRMPCVTARISLSGPCDKP